jgi:hypothetical protein
MKRLALLSLFLSAPTLLAASLDYSTVSGTVYDADDITGTTVFSGNILFNPRSQVFTNADGLVLVNSSRNVRLVDGYFSTTLYSGMYDLVLNGCTNEVTLSGGTDYDLGTLLVGVENGKVIVNSYGGGGSTNITDSGTNVVLQGGATMAGTLKVTALNPLDGLNAVAQVADFNYASSFRPTGNASRDLGNTGRQWRNTYSSNGWFSGVITATNSITSLSNIISGGTYHGNGEGLTNITLTGPTNDAPVDTATVKAWVNFTNSTGGVFKYPLYQ